MEGKERGHKQKGYLPWFQTNGKNPGPLFPCIEFSPPKNGLKRMSKELWYSRAAIL